MPIATRNTAGLLAALLLLAANSASAAEKTYVFNGTLDSGASIGETFSGQFNYDDAALLGSGEEYLAVNSVSLDFLGQHYTQANAAAAPEAAYLNGIFLGLSFNVKQGAGGIAVIPGYLELSSAYFAYDTPIGLFGGAGSVAYTLAPVPEPETWALLLAGLGLVGFMARRKI